MLATAGVALGGLAGVDTDALTLKQRDIRMKGWPREAAGFRLGHLSDFHCDGDAAAERIRRAVVMLMRARPDAVALTGDFITTDADRWMPLCMEMLTPLLAAPQGVYCVMGNHDWNSGGVGVVSAALRQAGMTVLRNQSASLPTMPMIQLVGLDDCCAQRDDVAAALKHASPDARKILLVHEPDYADGAPPGFALQLSGHSHGGQIRIPGLPVLHAPQGGQKYPEGLQHSANHLVYTTRGLGLIGPQFRYFCPPEVTLLRLHPA